MPSPATTTTTSLSRPETLIQTLTLSDPNNKIQLLKTLREIKNQIIGNKTKKLLYLKLGAVPKIISILNTIDIDIDSNDDGDHDALIVVQAAAAIGSFACGVEDGVRAVVDAGGVDCLVRILKHSDDKVVDAGARSLRLMFQSKMTPKFEFLKEKNMKFLLSLLDNENENVRELAASIISHSCEKSSEQKALTEVGVLDRLVNLLKASLHQRDSYLDSIAAIVRNNPEVATNFACINNGKALISVTELIQDRSPRTRLHASICLIAIGCAAPCYVQELQTRTKLLLTLVELLEEPDRVGDDAPFALTDLIAGNEELHKQAVSINAIEKLCNFRNTGQIRARRLEGILLALAELCSKHEECRCQLISLQVVDIIADKLKHDSVSVRMAACTCIKSISRSVKNLSAGTFSNDRVLIALIQLLNDTCTSVQVAALESICNVAINFNPQKSIFIQYGGVTQLVQLSNSMDSKTRLKSLCVLRNLMFLGNGQSRHHIITELTASTLASLLNDSEPLIQEQALGLVSNFTDGFVDNIDYLIKEDSTIIDAIVRLLHCASSPEVCIQGMFLLSNIAAGDESHKETVLNTLIPLQADIPTPPFIINFLQSKNNLLRTASVWCIINLTHPDSTGLSTRVARLQHAGIISQLKMMVNDPFLDCKFRVKMVLRQCTAFESNST